MANKKALVAGDSPAVIQQITDNDVLLAPDIQITNYSVTFSDESTGVFGAGGAFSEMSMVANSTFISGFFQKQSSVYLVADRNYANFSISADSWMLYGDDNGNLQWSIHDIWHSGNHGPGSSLDADLLDGQHGSYYLNASNMNAGTLAVARGGTGQTTLALARNAMGLGNTTGALPIANGGTGATTAALARNALGLGNTTGALPIANGGTGATTAALARNNLGLGNTTGALPIANGGTGATNIATARSNLGLGTMAQLNVPGSTNQILYNSGGSLSGSSGLTFDGTTLKATVGQARMRSIIQNANTTINSTNFPEVDLIIKKTSTATVQYVLAANVGVDDSTITVINASTSGNITIAPSGVNVYKAGVIQSTLIVGPRQIVTLYRMSSTVWLS